MAPGGFRKERKLWKKKKRKKEILKKCSRTTLPDKTYTKERKKKINKIANNKTHMYVTHTHTPTKGENASECTIPEQLQCIHPSSRPRFSRVQCPNHSAKKHDRKKKVNEYNYKRKKKGTKNTLADTEANPNLVPLRFLLFIADSMFLYAQWSGMFFLFFSSFPSFPTSRLAIFTRICIHDS